MKVLVVGSGSIDRTTLDVIRESKVDVVVITDGEGKAEIPVKEFVLYQDTAPYIPSKPKKSKNKSDRFKSRGWKNPYSKH